MSLSALYADLSATRSRISELESENKELDDFHAQIHHDRTSCEESIWRQVQAARRAASLSNMRCAALFAEGRQSELTGSLSPALMDFFSQATAHVMRALDANEQEIARLRRHLVQIEYEISAEQERIRREQERRAREAAARAAEAATRG